MSERIFNGMIRQKWHERKYVCLGLDSDPGKIPEMIRNGEDRGIASFNFEIIDGTFDAVCAYKLNVAFYEALGVFGLIALKATVNRIRFMAPEVLVIGDMKRGDTYNTNLQHIKTAFEYFDFDAITVNPYLGMEALQPFLDQKNKGIFVLCRTSNGGAGEFQNINVAVSDRQMPLHLYVAHRVAKFWNRNGNCGLVVGATCPEELYEVRMLAGDDMPILIPGIGEQGGDLEKTVKAVQDNMIINAGRSAIFASSGRNFAEAARKEVVKLQKEIDRYMGEA